jgi:hypothetical protein
LASWVLGQALLIAVVGRGLASWVLGQALLIAVVGKGLAGWGARSSPVDCRSGLSRHCPHVYRPHRFPCVTWSSVFPAQFWLFGFRSSRRFFRLGRLPARWSSGSVVFWLGCARVSRGCLAWLLLATPGRLPGCSLLAVCFAAMSAAAMSARLCLCLCFCLPAPAPALPPGSGSGGRATPAVPIGSAAPPLWFLSAHGCSIASDRPGCSGLTSRPGFVGRTRPG